MTIDTIWQSVFKLFLFLKGTLQSIRKPSHGIWNLFVSLKHDIICYCSQAAIIYYVH